MGKLDGKVALVTGGSTGIGLATAQQLIADGAYVFITGRRQKELEAALELLGGDADAIQSDVSHLGELDRVFDIVRRTKGHLDILFANAGVAATAPLGEITEEEFDREFNINVKGALFTVQKALPLLRDGASVILNASVAASKGVPGSSVYSATKAALRSFARTFTADLKDRHIRVNVVSPGTIETRMYDEMRSANREQFDSAIGAQVPMGHPGQPEDIAKAVAFLASEDSRYVTGIELFVDGGLAQV